MASEGRWSKRAELEASRGQCSGAGRPDCAPTLHRDAAGPPSRSPSADDDLALSVEASLYGQQRVRSVQEFLRWTKSNPGLSRWSSLSSASACGSISVMDILKLWDDDPEELLLDLGFGCDEPDLSGRIPSRFINYPSQAKGINLQVFLEAQKSRIDLENPDVSNRFRQIEVLQHVTTAFSTLMASSTSSTPAEARERRKRMGALLRRASKKSQLQMQNNQDPPGPPAGPGEQKVPLKRAKSVLQDTVALSPLIEEQGAAPAASPQPAVASYTVHEGALMSGPLREGKEAPPVTVSSAAMRKRSPGQTKESFEMEEIHSFDDSSVAAGSAGGAETSVRAVIRTNSWQSDSSGFLEEPIVPTSNQQPSPAPDLIKALSGLSEGSAGSQSSERDASSSRHAALGRKPPSPSSSPSAQPSSPALSSDHNRSKSGAQSRELESHPAAVDGGSDVARTQSLGETQSEQTPTLAGSPSQSNTHPPRLLPEVASLSNPRSTRHSCFHKEEPSSPSPLNRNTSTSHPVSHPPESPAPDGQSMLSPALRDPGRPSAPEAAANSSERGLLDVGTGHLTVRTPQRKQRSERADADHSHAKSSAGFTRTSASASWTNASETGAKAPSSLRDELLAATTQEGGVSDVHSRTVGTKDGPHTEHASRRSKASDLIEVETLDQVFETSVDGSECEFGDVDAFFQQLDSEGRVYWAEPIAVSSLSSVVDESGSFEGSDGNPADTPLASIPAPVDSSPGSGEAASSPPSSTSASASADKASDTPSISDQAPFSSPTKQPAGRSVSVQMSKTPSSHIVHRRDVPYTTDTHRTLATGLLPLDTSTPFRAVQSWTDLNIQRNTFTKSYLPSPGALCALTNTLAVSASALDVTQRPPIIFSSSPSFHLQSKEWRSHDCLSGLTKERTAMSVSVDTGLWPDEDEDELDKDGDADEKKLWESSQTASSDCCALWEPRCDCCTHNSGSTQHTRANITFSLRELQEMMLCLQQFCAVLSNMEEQLSEDQAAVYSGLSEQDRETLQDIAELRRAVKEEAGELETQLNELAHDYDDSLKTKMQRLLDEQSLLCSQLRVPPPSRGSAPHRTVATQCSLLPWTLPAEAQSVPVSSWTTWDANSPRESPAGSESLSCSPSKADKLDILGFLQRLKESLRPPLSTDALE